VNESFVAENDFCLFSCCGLFLRITEEAHENPPRAPNNLLETNYFNDSERKTRYCGQLI